MHSEEKLWQFVEGELPSVQAAEIEEQAAGDDVLRERIETIRMIKKELIAGAPRPPEGFPARMATLAARLPTTPVVHLEEARRFLRRALVAAAILAALGLAYLAIEVLPQAIGPDPIRADSLLGE